MSVVLSFYRDYLDFFVPNYLKSINQAMIVRAMAKAKTKAHLFKEWRVLPYCTATAASNWN